MLMLTYLTIFLLTSLSSLIDFSFEVIKDLKRQNIEAKLENSVQRAAQVLLEKRVSELETLLKEFDERNNELLLENIAFRTASMVLERRILEIETSKVMDTLSTLTNNQQ
ncbi:hypothetical protein Glove_320g200 [Diversispora epigaea]|uniref:Uncharacterized protein n=1 Tax=Diversispora epigaea TaxID=1348612 RepID=A0A397HNL4_9GLOM|nr:hypothetical protein Glove_320g200 [Diversispora epigaea]